MADVVPFPCIRPRNDMAKAVAALPYDVYNLAEAKTEIAKNPKSFLCIDMAEATFDKPVPAYDSCIYEAARAQLDSSIADGTYIEDSDPHYYLYRLCTADDRCQTGVVGCSSIDDYLSGVIKKHENTRADKETDRMRHVDTCSAQTGPIFLAFRSDGTVETVMERVCLQEPLYDFIADDGVGHTVWRVDNARDAAVIQQAFAETPSLYIADGHHRAASAVKAGLLRREQAAASANTTAAAANPNVSSSVNENNATHASAGAAGVQAGTLPSDHFLSVIFPSNQLTIMDYNRVVTDLNGLTKEAFLDRIRGSFEVSEPQESQFKPLKKGSFGMYLDGFWYGLTANAACASDDPVAGLDVSILQNELLAPILGIKDPRTDSRIDFVGGIRGLDGLECRVKNDMAVAFALYPTSIEELFAVADAGLLMPPKSTWFEPKPRSGIFIHRI